MVDAHNKAQLELLQLQVEKLRLENKKLADSMRINGPVQGSATGVLAALIGVLLSK